MGRKRVWVVTYGDNAFYEAELHYQFGDQSVVAWVHGVNAGDLHICDRSEVFENKSNAVAKYIAVLKAEADDAASRLADAERELAGK